MAEARALASDTLAPWAEIVPGRGYTTVDDMLALPDDDGWQYEVVEGVLVRMAGSGKRATTIAFGLGAELRAFVRPRRLGVVTGADGVYKFRGAETGLTPHVGYYTAARNALITDEDRPIPFAPDLAVEVASPSQFGPEMKAKAKLYLEGETRLVWIIWPAKQRIDVWRSGHIDLPVLTLGIDDALNGEDVVPGFTYPVADVFADPLG